MTQACLSLSEGLAPNARAEAACGRQRKVLALRRLLGALPLLRHALRRSPRRRRVLAFLLRVGVRIVVDKRRGGGALPGLAVRVHEGTHTQSPMLVQDEDLALTDDVAALPARGQRAAHHRQQDDAARR